MRIIDLMFERALRKLTPEQQRLARLDRDKYGQALLVMRPDGQVELIRPWEYVETKDLKSPYK